MEWAEEAEDDAWIQVSGVTPGGLAGGLAWGVVTLGEIR